MDIRVGSTPRVGTSPERARTAAGSVEAKVLAVRAPRRRAAGPTGVREKRRQRKDRDPVNGRVLVLLIPDGSVLPEGIDRNAFRVFLRFARR